MTIKHHTIRAPKNSAVNTMLGLLAIGLWSSSIAISRSLMEQLGIFTTISLVYGLGGMMGCGHLMATGKLRALFTQLDRRYLWGCGALFVGNIICMYTAMGLAADHRQMLAVGLLNYLWPVLTVLLSVPILRMRATLFIIPGVLLALLGTALAMLPPSSQIGAGMFGADAPILNVTYLLGGGAALSWGLYSTLSRRWGAATADNAVPVFMLATGLLLGAARLMIPEATYFTGRAVFELIFQIIASLLAYSFWDRAMRGGNLVLVATSSYFTPLLSTLISSLYLGVVPGSRLWWGCGLVIAGAVICKAAVHPPQEK